MDILLKLLKLKQTQIKFFYKGNQFQNKLNFK